MSNKVNDSAIADFMLSPRYRISMHLLLQLVLVLITVSVFWNESLQSFSFGRRLLSWIVNLLMLEVVVYANLFLLIPRFLLANRFGLYLLTASGIIMVTKTITAVLRTLIYGKGLSELYPDRFVMLMNVLSELLTIGFVTAGVAAILLFRHWILHNQRIDELQSTLLHSQFKYLKNRISPHLLFSMLEGVRVLMRKNPAKASKALFKLEDLLRYRMNDGARGFVSLGSDIDYLDDYLKFEKMRRKRFEYTIDREGETEAVRTPPQLFIPFVENAVKHSFDRENLSYVHLSFILTDKHLYFRCENSKPLAGTNEEGKIGGSGLAHIRRRLALLYPGRYLLEREETADKYAVNLHLDL